jgi:signal transduction histidine kinase
VALQAKTLFFYLLVIEGYLLLARRRRLWGILWAGGIALIIWLTTGLLQDWQRAVAIITRDVPVLLLLITLLELRLRAEEHQEEVAEILAELIEVHQELKARTAQVEALAIAEERTRLAREIHDTLGHTLTALDVQLALAHHLPTDAEAQRAEAITRAQGLVRSGLQELRQAVQALRPNVLETRRLPDAVRQLTKTFEETHGLPVEFTVEGAPATLPPAHALSLYRAAQEALTNVGKHSKSVGVSLRLRFAPDEVILEVTNNGAMVGPVQPGNGLMGMRERIERLDGRFYATPRPEGGFCVRVSLPSAPSDD